jgi:hypothetical protein
VLIWTLIAVTYAANPFVNCKATTTAPQTVLLSCGEETLWFSERPAGPLETILVDFSTDWVREAGAQMVSSETSIVLGAASYRGYRLDFPDAGKRRTPQGVLLAHPVPGGVRAVACVSQPYGTTCERMLRALLEDGIPPGLTRRTRALWLDRPLVVPAHCDYGDMGAHGGGISCGEELFVWVNTQNLTQAEQAIADTFHQFATELQGRTGPAVPCTVAGTPQQCHTLVDDLGTRAWFTAVEIDGMTAFQYCLSETANQVPAVCSEVLQVP